MGSYFSGWMFNSSHNEFPFFTYNENRIPSLNDQLSFIKAYIDEYTRLNKISESYTIFYDTLSVDKLLLEIKLFSLLFNLKSVVWAKKQVALSKIKFGFK